MDDFGNDITKYTTEADYMQWCISMSVNGSFGVFMSRTGTHYVYCGEDPERAV